MDKNHLIKAIASSTNLPKKEVEKIINNFLLLIKKGAVEHNQVAFKKFGSFKVKHGKARKGRNFKIGELIVIPENKTTQFNPSKLFEGYTPKKNEKL